MTHFRPTIHICEHHIIKNVFISSILYGYTYSRFYSLKEENDTEFQLQTDSSPFQHVGEFKELLYSLSSWRVSTLDCFLTTTEWYQGLSELRPPLSAVPDSAPEHDPYIRCRPYPKEPNCFFNQEKGEYTQSLNP
ncbi:zinc finger protein 1035 isoform X2 [Nerophis lumbriciformis]|uniref:zinc finger protein 1035 isoform X2 n=1 Tax=Nerophis lumbriciformis TaxID=546530 RepID=UPI003BAAA2F7